MYNIPTKNIFKQYVKFYFLDLLCFNTTPKASGQLKLIKFINIKEETLNIRILI